MAAVEFVYRLTGTGWSEATVRVGEAWAEATASYLGDALGDLIRATVAVMCGPGEARASWAEEPGEFRWILRREGDRLRLRLLTFGDDGYPDDRGRELIAAECDHKAFGAAIAEGARRVLEEWGEAGYRRRWVEHEFPTAMLLELEDLLVGKRAGPGNSPGS